MHAASNCCCARTFVTTEELKDALNPNSESVLERKNVMMKILVNRTEMLRLLKVSLNQNPYNMMLLFYFVDIYWGS